MVPPGPKVTIKH